jgi:hypothetical protein
MVMHHLGVHFVRATQNLFLNFWLKLGLKQNTYTFLYNTIPKQLNVTLLTLHLRSNHSFEFQAVALHYNT